VLPVEDKESYRWIEALETTTKVSAEVQVITVCDRECDFYDFFKSAEKIGSAILVRASQNRTVNRGSRYAEKNVSKLWDHIMSKPTAGFHIVDIAARQKTRHCRGASGENSKNGSKIRRFHNEPTAKQSQAQN
jgi:hypothetical protein